MAEERTQRRLAAILAADVVGYSHLMELDEAGTLAALKSRRREVLEPLAATHQGRVFKVTGDGVLVEFASTVNALQCAVDLQQGMAKANEGQPDDRHIVLRIGVNLGDVMVEGGDLYGEGVNIAARLEASAEPGGILVSESARHHIGSRVKVGFEDIGPQSLKNIAQPVRAYRVTNMPTVAVGSPKPVSDKPSIAVLPFANMSGDPGQVYFSDGITEDIITELSRFRELLVIARNSSFQYRDKNVDVKRVGRELGVQFVIEGSIRRLGDHVRVSAQLIDATTGSHVWAERYDRDMHDIFALQDELAHAVAAAVGSRIEAAREERAIRLSPAGLTSYDLVLRGEALRLLYSRSENEAAKALYQKAIDIDPANARAHAYYANTCFVEYEAHWVVDRDRSLRNALQFAKRAVTLDGADTAARWTLGSVYLYMRDYAEARVHIEKACRLNPNDNTARGIYGLFLCHVGEAEKAIEELELVRRRNPLDPLWVPWVMGIAYFTARRYEEAIATLIQIHEPINEVRGWLSASYALAGHLDQAKAMLREFLAVAEHDMAVFPGQRLSDWVPYWHGAIEYQDQRDFDHLFDALRKAGMPE